jgi:hypothetical protein
MLVGKLEEGRDGWPVLTSPFRNAFLNIEKIWKSTGKMHSKIPWHTHYALLVEQNNQFKIEHIRMIDEIKQIPLNTSSSGCQYSRCSRLCPDAWVVKGTAQTKTTSRNSVQTVISKDHTSVEITCTVAFLYQYFKEIYSCLYTCLLLGGLKRLQCVTQSAYTLLVILTTNNDYGFKQN